MYVVGKLEKFRSHLFTEILIFKMRALNTEIVRIDLSYFKLLFLVLSKTQVFLITLRVGRKDIFFRII